MIRAPRDGVVKQVLYKAGDTVDKGASLVEMEKEEGDESASNGDESD